MIHPINVKLARSELDRVKQNAALRYQLARAGAIKDRLVDTSRSGKDADEPGLKAEIAVAKLLDINFNDSAMGIDPGSDLYVMCGVDEVALQVKTTHHINAQWCLMTDHGKDNWDVLVFVRPTELDSVMQVYGWIGINEYEEKLQEVDLGHGLGKGVHIDDLRGMEELWRVINEKRSL